MAFLPNPPQNLCAVVASSWASLQVVFYDRVNGSHAVFPTDLLSFRISPAAVGNADFVDSAASASEFGDKFWLNAKTIFFNLDRFVEGSFEGLVARFHVRQIKVREDIEEQSQKPVAGHMPEKKNAMWSPTHEPGPKN